MLSPRLAILVPVVVLALNACTPDGGAPADSTSMSPPGGVTTEPAHTQTMSPPGEVVFGTGTLQVDGTEVLVRGDCDISRNFGEVAVGDVDDPDLDVLLAVDNVTASDGHEGPFAISVRLLGSGALVGRTITSVGAPAEGGGTIEATYEGTVTAAAFRDRRELEFVDVVTLHLEATQQLRGNADAPDDRELVVDVTCPVSRPG